MSGKLLLDPVTGLPLIVDGLLVVAPQLATPPVVSVLAASPVVDVLEGETAVLRVSVTPPITTVDLTFDYATASGTATSGTDFAAITSSSAIPVGAGHVDLLIPTISRVGTNGSRSFSVVISNVQAGTAPISITNATATITIADVGAGVVLPTLGLETVTAQDEGTSLVFRVRASKTHSANVSFTYTTVDGSAVAGVDYTTQSGGKTITIGQDYVDITVPTTERAGYQGARALSVLISAATDGTNTIEIHTPTVNGIIRETETPTATGSHDYFELMIAHPNYQTGYSMRPVPGQAATYGTGHPHAGKRNPYYANQMLGPNQGGFGSTGVGPYTRILYSPSTDTHPQAKDATRTVMPSFEDNFVIKAPITDSATVINLQITLESTYLENGTSVLIDDELMYVSSSPTPTGQPSDGTGGRFLTVVRGYAGTVAVAHPTTSFAKRSNNTIWPSWRAPVGTANGFSYFITWDFLFTDDYMPAPLRAYKAFQLESTTGSNWFEMQTRFGVYVGTDYQPPSYDPGTVQNPGPHLGVVTWRAYGNMTHESDWVTACSGKVGDYGRYNYTQGIFDLGKDPLGGGGGQIHAVPSTARNGGFIMWPNRWNRCFMFYKQTVNDWDDMTVFMADEVQEPRQELHTMKMSIDGATTGSARKFWLELNTSKTEFERPWIGLVDSPADLLPLTAYHRNLVVHRMPHSTTVEDIVADPDLLVKPLP